MQPKAAFDITMQRVDRLLGLYHLLRNTRERRIRRDWARKFKKLMHWAQGDKIDRVDGKGALLILRETSKFSAKEFTHDELGEFLRAALAASVSALDRYCHEVVLSRVMAQLRRSESNWPRELKKLTLPISVTKTAVAHARVRRGRGGGVRTRPMNIVRHALQDQFHRYLTMQNPDDIARAFNMVGIDSLWSQCGKRLGRKPGTLIDHLRNIVARRNQIVHEGDIRRFRRGQRLVLNEIDIRRIQRDIKLIRDVVGSIDYLLD